MTSGCAEIAAAAYDDGSDTVCGIGTRVIFCTPARFMVGTITFALALPGGSSV